MEYSMGSSGWWSIIRDKFLTAESIGIGDGLLFLVTGIFLGFTLNVKLLYGTLFLAGGYSFFHLLLKKKGRKDRVAMVPFVFIAYVLFVL